MADIAWPVQLPEPFALVTAAVSLTSQEMRTESGYSMMRRLTPIQPATIQLGVTLNSYQIVVLDEFLRTLGTNWVLIPMFMPTAYSGVTGTNKALTRMAIVSEPSIQQTGFDRYDVRFSTVVADMASAAQSPWDFYSATGTTLFYNAPSGEFYIERQTIT